MRVRNPRQGRISEPDQSCGLGSPSKNGRLGDPALPSLSSNSFHVKNFHPRFLERPSGGCLADAGSLLPAGDFCGVGGLAEVIFAVPPENSVRTCDTTAARGGATHAHLRLIQFQGRESFQIRRVDVGYCPEFESIAFPVENIEAVFGEAFPGCTRSRFRGPDKQVNDMFVPLVDNSSYLPTI